MKGLNQMKKQKIDKQLSLESYNESIEDEYRQAFDLLVEGENIVGTLDTDFGKQFVKDVENLYKIKSYKLKLSVAKEMLKDIQGYLVDEQYDGYNAKIDKFMNNSKNESIKEDWPVEDIDKYNKERLTKVKQILEKQFKRLGFIDVKWDEVKQIYFFKYLDEPYYIIINTPGINGTGYDLYKANDYGVAKGRLLTYRDVWLMPEDVTPFVRAILSDIHKFILVNESMEEDYEDDDYEDIPEEMHKERYVTYFETQEGRQKYTIYHVYTDSTDDSYNELCDKRDNQLGMYNSYKELKDALKERAEKIAAKQGWTVKSIENLGEDDEYYKERNKWESIKESETQVRLVFDLTNKDGRTFETDINVYKDEDGDFYCNIPKHKKLGKDQKAVGNTIKILQDVAKKEFEKEGYDVKVKPVEYPNKNESIKESEGALPQEIKVNGRTYKASQNGSTIKVRLIAKYDDADYYYAIYKPETQQLVYTQNGGKNRRSALIKYNNLDKQLDEIAKQLDELNKPIKPVMVHESKLNSNEFEDIKKLNEEIENFLQNT